jgi:hypothetical protein
LRLIPVTDDGGEVLANTAAVDRVHFMFFLLTAGMEEGQHGQTPLAAELRP